MFGPREMLLSSEESVVRQFLNTKRVGPIGMLEGSSSSPPTASRADLNTVHKRVRARVEHALAHMKSWNVLRNCRRKRNGVYYAARGVALMRNLAMAH